MNKTELDTIAKIIALTLKELSVTVVDSKRISGSKPAPEESNDSSCVVNDASSPYISEASLVPVEVFVRHVYLSQEDLETCFGEGYELTHALDLVTPGEFIAKETVTVSSKIGKIEDVRIFGPVTENSQVELLKYDTYELGIKPPVREFGDIEGSAPIRIAGPKGAVKLYEGATIAQRYITMKPSDAEKFGVRDRQVVSIDVLGSKGGVLRNFVVKVSEDYELACHLDREEADTMGLNNRSNVRIVK